MQRVTRDDVARLAGTSPAVVSYVLNNGPRPVAPATRARVEQAIADLGYRPNLVARALRSTRSNVLGLVVPDSSEGYFTQLTHAVERAAFARGSLVLLGNSAFSREQELRYAESLANMRVDGLLLVRAEIAGAAATHSTLDVPVVYLHHHAPSGSTAPSVVLDNKAGGRLTTEHLLGHGYREIGCLTGTARSGPVADRARGWAEAMRAAERKAGNVVRTGLDRHAARADIRRWLQSPERPRAIMATADGLALDTLTVAAELGLSVPKDLAVIGFGGTDAAAHSWPALSTAGHSFDDFADAAVSTLDKLRENTQPEDRILDVRLTARASCGCD
ncbi:LacI family DNA-binding transcriptional regulator [Amycolatopsis circi]|uniref:LacI family DNA-binding transcriptional regulator n=1 Tax=Amycolatopsis circi TaxID=871959 RepID=UPI000E27F320|nr:LacI family DNA-binding transcriptional regulator [Amycolatopsis circi]